MSEKGAAPQMKLSPLLIAALLLCTAALACAQDLQPAAQRARATLSSVIGGQATGMGGAFVAVANDGTALYWNPAALAGRRNTRVYGAIGGQSDNIDTLDELLDVADILEEEDGLTVQEFNTIRDVARRNDGSVIEGDVGAIGTVEINNFAIGYWAIAGGNAVLDYEQMDALQEIPQVTESVDWDGDAVGQAGAGVAYGRSISTRWDLGITARLSALSVAAADGRATATTIPEPAVGLANAYDVDTETTYTVDIGAMYRAGSHSQFGIVGRNLTSPSFDLMLERPSGVVEMQYEIEPSFDLGYSWMGDDGGVFAVDVHNVTEANDVGCEIAVGVSTPLADWLDARFGYGNDQPTFGLGLNFGSVNVDIASALNWEDRVAISGASTF
ncbi:MAG: hypothetical protein GF393_09095 [Armatimonadia bacterium]|nr:hypothetical protein [Armatimonadia bacterium]